MVPPFRTFGRATQTLGFSSFVDASFRSLEAAGIAEYLQSDKRPSNYWGSDWLKKRGGKGWGQLSRDSPTVDIAGLLIALTLGLALMKKSLS